MKPSLQLRQSQHLALTPQLQQSIRLLQLSTLELQQEVQQMLDANPLLELDGDDYEPGVSQLSPPEASVQERAEERGADEGGAGERELSSEDFGTTAQEDWANGTEGDDFDGIRELPANSGTAAEGDEDAGKDFDAPLPTLSEHLREQLVGRSLSEIDRAALWLLIESLDDDGYLVDSLEELAQSLAGEDGEDAQGELLEQLRIALALLQSLDPPGVGARSLGECLQLQLRGSRDPAAPVARLLCAHHLEHLARRDWRRLALLTQSDEATVKAAQGLIARLEPKPGRRFARDTNTPVVPDVLVRPTRGGKQWRVEINPEVLPKLRVNEMYARALKSIKGAVSGSPLGGQLQEARWFIKNIQQRFDTIQRVSQAIVDRQTGFFSHGELAMRPLVLREIADELGLHESTISRVTTAKYMHTPHGTFELKFFFGSGLSTETGGEASSTAVRALIRQFIDAEDRKKPLSDSQLSTMLEEQGIQCARRTVAKYREGMKIATAPLRKEI
ncbi:MAG: RNA polymerase factor sigma-54 [Burkholderiales bacterium]|uniref:RNA polymerase factor sigma-54 n=1 Tax=Inhella sp. TaxID=1921806 RepID=UPI001AC6CD96|nr:RNA polymerase factor sigma-54 [Burkholderiales bacterium]